jgi:hypothetical protein
MSKELPYFKAFPSQWLGGDIMYLSKEDKGSFIDACFHYWNKDCKMTYTKMSRRIGKESLYILIDESMIEKKDNQIKIKFLDKQYKERKEQYLKRVDAAKKSKKKTTFSDPIHKNTDSLNKFLSTINGNTK